MRNRLEHALAEAPADIAGFLSPLVLADNFGATLSKDQYSKLLQISGLNDSELKVALLPFAAAYAHASISNFYVGAIAEGLSGQLYFGANMEIAGTQLGQTVHAEQSAISHAWMKGEQGIVDITINFSPCGHCRQFMNELATAEQLSVQLPSIGKRSLQSYLPDSFGPSDLGIKSGLMAPIDHGNVSEEKDEMITLALSALNKSYAPYTKNYSGVCIKMKSGKIYQGSYAENAAFNPSLPPLQVALSQILLAGHSFEQIESATLVEMLEGSCSHLETTQSTLEAINPDIPLTYLAI